MTGSRRDGTRPLKNKRLLSSRTLDNGRPREVFAVTRQALKDLANKDLEQQIVDVFIRRIERLSGDEQRLIAESVNGSGKILITSAFQIPDEGQARIFKTIKEHINGECNIDYQVAADVISGIELRTVGHKIAWSLESYLASLETNVLDAMETGSRSEGQNEF